jgi:hypothetical protein
VWIESRPAGMYLLKKVIQIRENSHPDHEKPFLEHLEDLRVMVTRIVHHAAGFSGRLLHLPEAVDGSAAAARRTGLDHPVGGKTAQPPVRRAATRSMWTWEKAKALERAAIAWMPRSARVFSIQPRRRGPGVPRPRSVGPAARRARPAGGKASGVSRLSRNPR